MCGKGYGGSNREVWKKSKEGKEQMLLDFELVTLSAITEIQLSTVRRCCTGVLLQVVRHCSEVMEWENVARYWGGVL